LATIFYFILKFLKGFVARYFGVVLSGSILLEKKGWFPTILLCFMAILFGEDKTIGKYFVNWYSIWYLLIPHPLQNWKQKGIFSTSKITQSDGTPPFKVSIFLKEKFKFDHYNLLLQSMKTSKIFSIGMNPSQI